MDLTKLEYSFVNDPKTDDLIRWSPSGNSFMVIDEDEFSKTLIPDLFKHNNYASFVRQLNMYGFHKVVGLADGSLKTSEQRSKPPSEYENPYFKRGQPDLMWLIQKPKSKTARGKGKKGVKQEDPDTDKDDNGSDGGGADGDISGGYIEGPKDTNDGLHHSGGRNQRVDVQAVVSQIEAVRNHQAMISAAINRLREDHQQLYEQSLAFQNLHDRHENSINAILAFLATVYDKSLAAHAGGAVSNLFSNQVDQGIHNATPGSTAGQTPNGAIIPTTTTARQAVMRTPQMNRRRKPLLLEGVPGFSDGIANGEMEALQAQNLSNSTIQTNGLPLQQNNYQTLPPSPTIQEVFTPAPGGNATSPSDSPQLQHVEQQLNGVKQPTLTSTIPFSPSKNQTNSPIIPSGSHPNSHFTPSTTDLPIPSPTSAGNIPVPSPIALPKENTPPFLGTALALQEHNASLAQKSQEIEELEGLQTKQNHNIDQLMGLMRNFSEIVEPPGNTDDDVAQDVEQFFDFGLQGDTFSGGDVLGEGGVDIDELLRGVEADHQQNLTLSRVLDVDQGVLMTASSSSSSTGSRSREEVDGDAEEGQPKRRKVN
jgi:heat shock transcription factor